MQKQTINDDKLTQALSFYRTQDYLNHLIQMENDQNNLRGNAIGGQLNRNKSSKYNTVYNIENRTFIGSEESKKNYKLSNGRRNLSKENSLTELLVPMKGRKSSKNGDKKRVKTQLKKCKNSNLQRKRDNEIEYKTIEKIQETVNAETPQFMGYYHEQQFKSIN